MEQRVQQAVVTGLGCVSPLGGDVATTWSRLIRGEDAQGPVTVFDVSGCRCKRAAEAKLPELPGLSAKRVSRLPRGSRLALPAAREALAQANLLEAHGRCHHHRLSMSVSTTGGGMALAEQFLQTVLAKRRGPGRLFNMARYQPHQQALDLQELLGFRGPVTIIANACASGANAVGHAADLIRAGMADVVLTGGYEPLTELIYVGFDCLQVMSPDKCRPFDAARNGLMLGEAAAFLVLESEAHARQRGATVLATLAGYGHGTDLHHLTQPDPRGPALVNAMRQALAQAQCRPADIGYLNAHGTGTSLNDASECVAFNAVFGADWPAVRLSSTKAAIGHTLGAAGAVEALFAVQALRTGELPPNLNVRQPEPAVAGNLVGAGPATVLRAVSLSNGARAAALRAAMSVNLGFGGANAALVFTPPGTQ